jgi:spoIIIJ-associated protein
MRENRATLEVIAPTVEEAIAKGLSDLGLTEDAVEVEVLDEGSRGLFGLGSRHARVRLAIKGSTTPEPAPRVAPAEARPAVTPRTEIKPPPKKEAALQEERVTSSVSEDEPELDEQAGAQVPGLDSEDMLDIARATVEELLERMRVQASVTAKFGQPDDRRNRPPIQVDISGRDLSILIGRQAETLNALQYIAGLIVSKELGHTVSVVVDVQGYRQRREQQLRQLARRMADQTIKSGRKQMLEPMPAAERRIIHIELRDNPYVTTESVGEEPRRKVTILPK